MKRCSRCGETKETTEFSPYKRSKDGLFCWCKRCNATQMSERYSQLSPEQRRKHNKQARGLAATPAARRARYRADPVYRAKTIQAVKDNYKRLRATLVAGYGGHCVCCSEAEPDFLDLDHVDGGGAAEYRKTPPLTVYRRLVREGFPVGYQLLCANCNHGRWRNNGVCPHKK